MNTEQPRQLAHVRAAVYGQPWAITENGMRQILAVIEAHVQGSQIDFQALAKKPEPSKDLGYDFQNNVAIIPVCGPIFPKANCMTDFSGATALSQVTQKMKSAKSQQPSAIILDMDSPGGSVSGLADFCEWLQEFQSSAGFPVVSMTNPMCCSAAFMIAASCTAAFSTSGGITGSIGTVMAIDNYDRAERNAGNDSVVLRSSELKAIGNGSISPNQIQELQRMLMMHDAKFKQVVEQGRPKADMSKVGTGQVWHGVSANDQPSALDLGLIDGISTLEKLIEQFGN